MNEKEAIDLLKHYRHTFSNHLQLITSYAQMGKLERVQEKSAELIKILTEDQQFQNMPLPKTIVTLMQLNHEKSGLEWKPIVQLDDQPRVDDQQLTELIQSIHQLILDQSVNLMLYHGTIKFQQLKNQPFQLQITCQGTFNKIEQLKTALLTLDKDIRIENATEERFIFNWTAQ